MSSEEGAAVYDELLADLKFLASRLDPVPEAVKAAARASSTWQRIDAELAELVYDSVVDDELVGVRGSGAARQLTFRGPGGSVEVEVVSAGRRLQGQVLPAREVDVEVRHRGGSTTVRSDALGHFTAQGVPPGPVSLRCGGGGDGGGAPTTTDWVVL